MKEIRLNLNCINLSQALNFDKLKQVINNCYGGKCIEFSFVTNVAVIYTIYSFIYYENNKFSWPTNEIIPSQVNFNTPEILRKFVEGKVY